MDLAETPLVELLYQNGEGAPAALDTHTPSLSIGDKSQSSKRIALVRNRTDVQKTLEWVDVMRMVDEFKKNFHHGADEHDPYLFNETGATPTLWIDFQGMESEDMNAIEQFFGLHHLTTEDILSKDAREKSEHIPSHRYHCVVTNELHYRQYSNILDSVNLTMLLLDNIILSFHAEPILCIHQVERLLEHTPKQRIPSPDWVLYALFDGIVDLLVALVDQTAREAESLDELLHVLEGVQQNEFLLRIGLAVKRASYLYSSLYAKKETLSALFRGDSPIHKANQIYVSSVSDHVLRMLQKLKQVREFLALLNGTYMAKVNIQLSYSGNQVNLVIRKLALISIVFIPMTLIAGLGGMNVRLPGMIGFDNTPPGHATYAWFIGIVLSFVLFAFICFVTFKRLRYI